MYNETDALVEKALICATTWRFWLIFYTSWVNGNTATDALRAIPSGV